MTRSITADTATDTRSTRRRRLRRIVRRTLYVKLALLVGVVVLAGGCYLRLVVGPVSLGDYSMRVGDALASRLGPGWRVSLRDTAIELSGSKPALRASGLEIHNPAGGLVIRAPYAMVSLDPVSLLVGGLTPREIDLRDLQLRVLIAADGSLSLAPPTDNADTASTGPATLAGPGTAVAAPDTVAPAGSPLSTAVASLLSAVMDDAGPAGAVDRATLTNARLTLVRPDGRERVGFERVGARFERLNGSNRRVDLRFESPHGDWRIGGTFSDAGGGRRVGDLDAAEVPMTDVMLLTGLSSVPAGTDLKMSGKVAAAVTEGRLASLTGAFESSNGTITRPGQPPLRVDRMAGHASWNESERRVDFADLDVRSGPASVRLGGQLTASDAGWRLKLAGRDATMAGAAPQDPPFKIADVAAELNFDETGVSLDRLALKGDNLDVSMSGASVPGGNGTGARAVIEATNTDIRRLFALWPPEVNSDLRKYLVDNMLAATLTRMRLKTDLDPDELRNVTNNKPISDEAVSLAFALADTRLNVFEGLPQLTRLSADGKASGTRISIQARGGRLDMPDGRRLDFSDGFYDQPNLDKRDSIARISFRLDGGADALAALLRSPALREGGGFDIDPANVKGRAAMKVSLPLAVHDIPKPANMPLTVAGSLSDLTLEKALGKEKLEGANLAVAYDLGALSVRGDGRVGGSPATIDLRLPRGAPGEVAVNLILDEAARLRRSLPSSPQVSGPVPVRIVAPFGPGAKGPMKLEADLTRAAIDGLLPGWTKPANRAGRLQFTLGEANASDLRDIVLDSGSTQLRGNAQLTLEGGLEKADLTTVKLSPGDDLRAQVERAGSGLRVSVRGNVGDARPVLKWLTGGPGSGGGGGKGREQPDIDLDLGVNIVTGFNDEAMTGVVANVSTRKSELRSLSVRGQFRAAPLEAQLSRRDGAPPVLTVQSADAGATLRFVDLYRRMVGGELRVSSVQGGDTQSGTIAIDNFIVRNEPALRRIAAQEISAGSDEGDRGSATSRIDADQVQFTKLTGAFRRTPSRTDFKDVVVWGSQVGFNLSGYLDTARDRTEVNGNFVPAYGLNNAFSQLPILGLILGGDRNEGLFAINFRVAGSPGAPTLTVNPISSMAPGILRKIFGAIMQDGETTGAVAPSPPQPPPPPGPRTNTR